MISVLLPSPLPLPGLVAHQIDMAALELLQAPGVARVDFASPPGEPALVGADSVSWQVFRNPASLFIGGVAAVLLELAQPQVRSGVWDHSSFRKDPLRRLRRTGLAAMVTVYGGRSQAEAMIAGVVRRHDAVQGRTPDGDAYRANDPELLDWVQATAGFGFSEAYDRYVRPLPRQERDRFYAEGAPAARLYGSVGAPGSVSEMEALFAATAPRLEASPIIIEFLEIMRSAPILGPALRPIQRILIRAAVSSTPDWFRTQLGLGAEHQLRAGEIWLVKLACRVAGRIMLRSSPAVQACRRLGLPDDYLYRQSG